MDLKWTLLPGISSTADAKSQGNGNQQVSYSKALQSYSRERLKQHRDCGYDTFRGKKENENVGNQ